jgi:hypothetical protein
MFIVYGVQWYEEKRKRVYLFQLKFVKVSKFTYSSGLRSYVVGDL